MNSIEYKTPKPEHSITMTRLLDAPVALVFKAWTDPARLAQWWGPHGFNTPVCVLEARAGGALHIVMRGPDGTDLPIRGEVIEVEPDRLLVYAMRADNSRGAWGTEGVPRDAVHSIRFAPEAMYPTAPPYGPRRSGSIRARRRPPGCAARCTPRPSCTS